MENHKKNEANKAIEKPLVTKGWVIYMVRNLAVKRTA